MPNMVGFVQKRNPVDTDDQQVSPPPNRPATAQKTRDAVEHNGNLVFDTDTEGFDATQSSIDGQDHGASDDFQDGEAYEPNDEQANQVYFGNVPPAPDELDSLMSQMERYNGHAGYNEPDSYPSTTSGEPDQVYFSEDEVERDQLQPQSGAKQHRDFPMTRDLQRNVTSTPLVIQNQPPRTQHAKDAYKVTAKPTILQKDVQRQKSQSKSQAVSQPVAKHALGQSQTTAQTAPIHQAAAMVPVEQPDQAHRQSARAQTTTATHRQKHVNEVDHRHRHINEVASHHQQRTSRAGYEEQHLNNIHSRQHNEFHQQQQGVEDLPEELYGQDIYAGVLDYELDKLYEKDFDELQNEPFDGPPHEDVHDAPSDSSSKPLEERLAAFSQLDVQSQRELFSSLEIEQWEEAGDWFQKRFSEIFGKLKAARRNRRDKASEFEQRIAQRQQAVTKKRKITDDALSEMKRTGNLVLTPKKKQRVAE